MATICINPKTAPAGQHYLLHLTDKKKEAESELQAAPEPAYLLPSSPALTDQVFPQVHSLTDLNCGRRSAKITVLVSKIDAFLSNSTFSSPPTLHARVDH